MPQTRISVRRIRNAADKARLIDAVHDALVETLKIPADDRVLMLDEYDADSFAIPPGRSERYTVVEVTLFAGRTVETKKACYQAIVRNLGALGIDPLDARIVLREEPRENWGIRGGQPASEVTLAFKVEV